MASVAAQKCRVVSVERDKAEPQSTTEYSRVVNAEQRDASFRTRVGARVDRSKRSYLQPIEGMLRADTFLFETQWSRPCCARASASFPGVDRLPITTPELLIL